MKLPDLGKYDEARVLDYHGHADAIEAAAAHAKLRYLDVDLSHAEDKASLFRALAKGLALPDHFGDNFDALADSLEDRDWLGKGGCAIRLAHAAHYRKTHPNDWRTLEDILAEASSFWRDRHVPFWVLVS
ncbi:MAG TPA: barstar family protein [Casimicrobiaceae bacterium]|nr:barstar family protein [Casimicrobiaceae bacterium]